ncbi:MAG: mechanosensitive ion channel [Phycisphaerales bacterium]|nr:mechanosensitive ion channel [Phycisphaerales bacterium]
MLRWSDRHGVAMGGVKRAALLLLVVAAWLSLAAPLAGQDAQPPAAPPDIRTLVEEILPKLTEAERVPFGDALESLAGLEESRRADARERLSAISADLTSIQTSLNKIEDLNQRIANAPLLLEQIRGELALPPAAIEIPAGQSIQQLEQGVSQAEAELKAAREDVTNLEDEARKRTLLREEIPTSIARARQEIETVNDEIESGRALGAIDPLSRLELLQHIVHRRALEQRITELETEQQSIEARREALRARQDRAARRVSQAEKRLEAWRQTLNEAREVEARRVADEARRALQQAANEHPVIQDLLKERTELASRHEQLIGQHQQAQKKRQALEAEVRDVRAQFARSFEEIERAGLTNTVGMILGRRRGDLPNVRTLRQEMRQRQQRLSEALGEQFKFERELDEIRDIGAAVERRMESLDSAIPREEREAVSLRLTEELRAQSALLARVVETLRDLSEEFSEADTAERALLGVTEEYISFIDERILWIRSTSPLRWSDLRAAGEVLSRFADPTIWRSTYDAFRIGAQRDPVPYVVLIVPLAAWSLLLFSGRRIGRVREALAEELNRDRLRPSFRPTVKAIGLLLLGSLLWPLLMLLVAQILAVSPDAPPAIQSLVEALRATAVVWLALEVGRRACRSGGFAEVHLRWPRESVAAVRRQIFWLECLVVPLDVLFRVVSSDGHEWTSESLARLAFIAGIVVLALFIQRTLRPHGPILRPYFAPLRGSWLARLSGLWFLVLVCLPLFLAVLTGLGYFYSAQRLQQGLSATLLLGLLMIIVSALFYRWLWVTRRRVAIDQALKRRAAAQEQAESVEQTPAESAAITEEEIDLPAANAQTLQLFRSAAVLVMLVALWGIWNNVLPALGLLDQFELWPHFGPVERVSERPESLRTMEVEPASPAVQPAGNEGASQGNGASTGGGNLSLPLPGQASDRGAAGASEPAAAVQRVTIADLTMAIIIGITTLILTRNIPGLLEIALLQRLPLDAGSRYAVSTIVRYVIVIVGVMVTFGAVGIGWSQIQWLAAALTFGLAFGLQEIFANFISGLIILIERPMRVGDTVTIGDISGEVSRIRMRATTITQWNKKELIVPNREFITGQLVNWTLTDQMLRLEIAVGIAYGSDTRLARSLLLKVANKCETVLKDPPPRALFLAFGDSALNFELRVFISGLNNYLDTVTTLNFGIDDEFRKAGIEISFPQRDIHIRTINGVLPVQQIEKAADAGEQGRGSEE